MALSGGLAACGGGGGSTDTSMMPTPQEMCADAGGRYNADGTCTSAEALEVERLQAQIAMLRQTLGIDDTADPNATIEQLQRDLAALQKQVDDAAEEAAMAAKKAAAAMGEALFTGLDVNRGGATDTTDDLAVALTSVTQGYGESAEVVATSVTVQGAAIDPVPEVEATDTMVSALGMWKGTELAHANDAGTVSQTVTVYTDVEANTSMSFDAVYGDDTNADGDLTMGANAATSTASYVPLISAPAFMHTGAMDHAPDAGPGDDVVILRLPGTFHGASGQYTCTADAAGDCLSHEDDNGVRLTGTGTWEFVPNPGAMVSVADSTYMYFGWWLHEDSTGPEVDAFHGVTGTPTAIDTTAFGALSGTATYSGAAAGKYALDPVAPGTYASGGHWTADASLTADFGTEATSGTISGMINNFMAGGEMMDWSVSLGETALATANDGSFTSAGDGGTTVGDDVVWTIAGEAAPEMGMWSGNLRDQGDNNVPMAATGEFSAVYSEGGHNIGHMIGAFGAHVDE